MSAETRDPSASESGFDEEQSEDAFVGGLQGATELDDLPSTGLLSFYDRLRERVLDAVEDRGGRLGQATVKALLLVPDVFMLLVRLSLDKEVPASTRALIGGALAYFVLPFDLLPEAVMGAGGYVDDLVLAAVVLTQAFSGDLDRFAEKHWSGPRELRVVLRDVSAAGRAMLGDNLYTRLGRLLDKRGVKLEDGRSQAPPLQENPDDRRFS